MGYWKVAVSDARPVCWNKPNCRWKMNPAQDQAILELTPSYADYLEMENDLQVALISRLEANELMKIWGNPDWQYPNELERFRLGYCSVADLRQRGITEDKANDDEIETAIARAVKKINSFCNRQFFLQTKSSLLDGDGTSVLFLEDWPIHEIHQIKINHSVVSQTSYKVYGEFGYIKLAGKYPKGNKNVSVSGVFGYATLPDEIKQACLLIAINELRIMNSEIELNIESNQSTENAIGLKRAKIEDITVEFEYPKDIKQGKRYSTGVSEADAILFKFKKDIKAYAV